MTIPIHKPREECSTLWNEVARLVNCIATVLIQTQIHMNIYIRIHKIPLLIQDLIPIYIIARLLWEICTASAMKNKRYCRPYGHKCQAIALSEANMFIISSSRTGKINPFDSQCYQGQLNMNFLEENQKSK